MIVLFHRDEIVQYIADTDAEQEALSNKLSEVSLAHTLINKSVLLAHQDYRAAVLMRIVKDVYPKKATKVYMH